MDHRDRIRAKAEARLARLRPNTGHARILRARLGLDTPQAPVSDEATPVVEPVVEEKSKVKRTYRRRSER